MMTTRRVVVWFSCGIASAVAAHLALEKYGKDVVDVVYCDTMSDEHPDNQRFFTDCEQWLGVLIKRIKSDRFAGIDEVFTARSYMSGIAGAPCTVELKKIPRFAFQRPDDIHIFGYTADETSRIKRFKEQNPELKTDWILLENNMSKDMCLMFAGSAGIDIPAMYKLGYRNNNCIGCVKATSAKYWNSIRKDFPEVFKQRVERSRAVGARLTRVKGKRVFLDELPPSYLSGGLENISCGPDCSVELTPSLN